MREEKVLKGVFGNADVDFSSEYARGTLAKSEALSFAHFNVGAGAATVAATLLNDKLYYSVALCSPEDNFSREIGRNCARTHMAVDQHSRKRGVLKGEAFSNLTPTSCMRLALERYLEKMRRRPQWLKDNSEVSVRGRQRHLAANAD